jgi:hypothetical protein
VNGPNPGFYCKRVLGSLFRGHVSIFLVLGHLDDKRIRISNQNKTGPKRLRLTTSETGVPYLIVGWDLQTSFGDSSAKRYPAGLECTKEVVNVCQRALFTNCEYESARRAAVFEGSLGDLDRASR